MCAAGTSQSVPTDTAYSADGTVVSFDGLGEFAMPEAISAQVLSEEDDWSRVTLRVPSVLRFHYMDVEEIKLVDCSLVCY